jgi:hypothetical protein
MRAVILDVPEALLAERRQLGLDKFDEMWEGVLHMVPTPLERHQGLEGWMVAHWWPLVGVVRAETGLYAPDVPGFSSYRVPDVVVARRESVSRRGIEGAAELVVEIRSEGDETYEKLPFYERVGVREMLVVELDHSLRHWLRDEERLVEVAIGVEEWVELVAVPVRLRRRRDGLLEMEGPAGVTTSPRPAGED